MLKAAKNNGLDATAVKSQDHTLDNEVQLPAIAHLRKKSADKTSLHYVVVYEVTDKHMVWSKSAKRILWNYGQAS